ncbi:MAG: Ig-like domain-containing protein [Armatimonadota bacterium]
MVHPRSRSLNSSIIGVLLLVCAWSTQVRAEPASITITPGRPLTIPGASVQLTATVRDASGAVIPNQLVTWAVVEGGRVGQIDNTGLFTGTVPGNCKIAASAGTTAASVTASVLPVGDRVILSLPTVVAKPGASPYIHVITSAAPNVVDVSVTVAVVPVNPSAAPIPTVVQSLPGQAAPNAQLTTAPIGPGQLRLVLKCPAGVPNPGILASIQLSFPSLPEDCLYSLELRDAVAVTSDGQTTSVDMLSGSLKVLSGSSGPPTSIAILDGPRTVRVGQTIVLSGQPLDASGTEVLVAVVSWSLLEGSDTASVTEKGVVTGLAPGTARVQAASGNATAQVDITVVPADDTTAGPVVSIPIIPGVPGEQVVVPVLISEVERLAGVQVTLSAEESIPPGAPLPIPGEVSLGPIAGGCFLGTNRNTPGRIGMAALASRDIEGPGVLFKVVFEVPTTAPGGTRYPIRIVRLDLSDGSGSPIPSAAYDGAIVLPTDETPPTASMSGPSPGSVVCAVVEVSADGKDDAAVARLDLLVDGTTVASSTSTPATLRWDTRNHQDGPHTLQVRATDTTGNVGLSSAVQVVVDNTQPEVRITSPASGAALSGRVRIAGTVYDANLRSFVVEYGIGQPPSEFHSAAAPGTGPVLNGTLAVVDTAAFPDGLGTFRLTAYDAAGNTFAALLAVQLDNTPPKLQVLSPDDGAVVGGPITVSADVQDASGVASVAFLLDGDEVARLAVPPYRKTLDASLLKDGGHTLEVGCADAAGNTAVRRLNLVVDKTPPTVSIKPLPSVTGGLVSISGSAADANLASFRLEYGRGGSPSSWNLIASGESSQIGVLAQWDTSRLSDGAYTIRLLAEDKAGNASEARATVTLDNTAPAVLIRKPAQSTAVGKVAVEAEVADVSSISEVRLLADSVVKASAFAGGPVYRFELDTSLLSDGTHRLTVEAQDSAGNVGSDSHELTVDNTPPTIRITSPSENSVVFGTVAVSANLFDPSGIDSVWIEYAQYSSPGRWQAIYSLNSQQEAVQGTWDASHLPPGEYIVRVRARDCLGNEGSAQALVSVPLGHHGDVNGDGRVSIGDAVLALRLAVGLDAPGELSRLAADVAPAAEQTWLSGDGRVTLADALLILRMALATAP